MCVIRYLNKRDLKSRENVMIKYKLQIASCSILHLYQANQNRYRIKIILIVVKFTSVVFNTDCE